MYLSIRTQGSYLAATLKLSCSCLQWRSALYHLRIYDGGYSPEDLEGFEETNANVPRYTTASLLDRQLPRTALETRRGCTNSFSDQDAEIDPSTYCADLCFEDEDCNYFTAYPVDFRHPGRCCFYESYDSISSALEPTAGGFFSMIRIDGPAGNPPHGWAGIMSQISQEGCTMVRTGLPSSTCSQREYADSVPITFSVPTGYVPSTHRDCRRCLLFRRRFLSGRSAN
eukprot:SAG31_NODE_851_length_11519_cov_4.727145_11_plen_227_part_00